MFFEDWVGWEQLSFSLCQSHSLNLMLTVHVTRLSLTLTFTLHSPPSLSHKYHPAAFALLVLLVFLFRLRRTPQLRTPQCTAYLTILV